MGRRSSEELLGTSEKFTDDFYEMAKSKQNVDSNLDALKKGKTEDL
jgi:hypothetical protein